jgi:hypothetical protein
MPSLSKTRNRHFFTVCSIKPIYLQGLRRQASNRIRWLDYVSGDAFEELLTH